jgi:SAM-dependent methyltransferase
MKLMNTQLHWEKVYGSKAADEFIWFRPHLQTSMSFIGRSAQDRSARIIDVGGGESTLVDDLLGRGYKNVTLLDISETAIAVTKVRLGERADCVEWLVGNVTTIGLPVDTYDVWHDRAVFHFLTSAAERAAYVGRVKRSVRSGGHVIIGTFGPEGPAKCSGLNVKGYDAGSLHGEFGRRFRLIDSTNELHQTPFGTTQQFVYCFCVVE